MRKQRVVITGMGAVSPYGTGVKALLNGLDLGHCALTRLQDHNVNGVECHVAGLVPELDAKKIPRELRRGMPPMGIFATLAAQEALKQAGLTECTPWPRIGVALGSTLGSPLMLHEFFSDFLRDNSVESVRSTTFFKIMSHTAASSVALACKCHGRMLSPSAACASGLVGMGLGYECIAAGREQMMLCGGADEFSILTAATFDRIGAASHAHDPAKASRPFDLNRDGIICAEGAGVLLLESLESALARNAVPIAEITGFASHTSSNIAQPDAQSIALCMQEALEDAACNLADIACVSAHATATRQGDAAEGQAIASVFGENTFINSLKGHLGHTMAASGALESIACVNMLQTGKLYPTLGLTRPDPECGALRHVLQTTPLTDNHKKQKISLLKNSFALGGCIYSLVIRTFYP